MKERAWTRLSAVAFLAAVVLRASAGAAGGQSAPAPLARGWGWILASGIASAVDLADRTVTVAVTGEGQAAVFEGGANWRLRPVSGTEVVRLLPAAVIADADREPVALAALRTGTPVLVWGALRPDASVLGLTLMMPQFRARPAPAVSIVPQPGISGVVIRSLGGVLDVLTPRGVRRSVIVTGATAVRSSGGEYQSAGIGGGPPGIAPFDLIKVEGTVNSDGSIASTHIEIELAAAGAAQVSGAVSKSFGDVDGLVVGGVMVAASGETYFLRGIDPAAFGGLAPGQAVTVYGTPISMGSVPIGLRARLVVMR